MLCYLIIQLCICCWVSYECLDFLSLQFCNLNKFTEVYLTWSNLECALLWAMLCRNFLLQNCAHERNFVCVKMRRRISPYVLCISVVFLCFLKQLQFRVLLVLSVDGFGQHEPVLQSCMLMRVYTSSFPSKEFIWTLTWKYQRFVGWAAFSNLLNCCWRAESAGRWTFAV